MMYLTAPTVLRVRPGTLARDERFDFNLANAEAAHGVRRRSPQWQLPPRSDSALDIETHGAAALRMARAGMDRVPCILFDCRSGHLISGPPPSYKLAVRAGLQRTPPVLLHGQGGLEPLQAMRFFAGMGSSAEVGALAMASSSGGIVVSACFVSRQPFVGRQLRVHGLALARDASDPEAALVSAMTTLMRQSNSMPPTWRLTPHGFDDIDIRHRRGVAALPALSPSVPDASRERDALQVLAGLAGQVQPSDGAGLLVFMGSAGSVGGLVVSLIDMTEVPA